MDSKRDDSTNSTNMLRCILRTNETSCNNFYTSLNFYQKNKLLVSENVFFLEIVKFYKLW
uniref:Uncharacterized protein n=1 Tax=Ciona intestinalis TaxID=7719 RepID=F6VGE8_CIOIN